MAWLPISLIQVFTQIISLGQELERTNWDKYKTIKRKTCGSALLII